MPRRGCGLSSRSAPLRETLPGFGRIVRRLWPYCREQRGLVVASLGALFATTFLRLLEPWPLKFIFDHVIYGEELSVGSRWFTEIDAGLLLLLSVVAGVVLTGSRAVSQYMNQVGFAKIGNRVLARVRLDLFAHLQRLSLSFHTSARSGDLTLRVIQDVNLLRDAAVTAVLPLMAKTLVLVGMWAIMFWMQWQLALVAALTLPFIGLRTASLVKRIRDASRKQRRRQGELASTAAESIGSIQNVQALSLEEVFNDEFGATSLRSQESDVKTARLTAGLGRWVDLLLAVATALVLWFGARSVLAGSLTAGELLVFLTYLRRAYSPAQDFAKYTGRLAKATAAGERVLDLLDREPEIRDRPGSIDATRVSGAVSFESVTFAYTPGAPAIRGVTFDIAAGERVAVVGRSGAGKSTLMSLMLRLYEPSEGFIRIGGRDIREYTVSSLRRQFSVVLQDSLLFAATVEKNIGYGSAGSSRDAVERAVALASARGFVGRLDDGYDTVIGERGATLSGGQKQRLAIARAAVRDAPILIFDEPTTGLDEESRRLVIEALERLADGKTTFWISHDLQLSRRADRVLVINEGRLVEAGTPEKLIARGGLYARMLRAGRDAPGSAPRSVEVAPAPRRIDALA